ncbi:thiol:disulfide interchange protein DsbE [marine gamma proteobacterium HTCC2143]|jgi:cytochrome c biogenesis protein CcmG/thiol:disulfide interchange protein DsbE|uniref:Thiol:disulfide interchange protein DsbE n=1 Tax=marine gamma proteobacterium HTCC2143 TaxID=247633 RepID=A0YC60_9GAMM|nr:thiol:disulfide interchange protein DsbE [marine gamma proteobacterium HTCC2143]
MQRLKLFLPLITFAAIAIFFYTMVSRIDQGEYNPQDLPSALINKPFPSFSLAKLEDLTVSLQQKDLLGNITLVNVWATWCPSCHVEHGYLNYLFSEKDMIIVGVNYKDKAPAAQRWLQTKGNPYRFNIFDPDGILGLDLGVTGAPETYVLDHRGFVRFRYQGPLNEMVWQDKFQALIEQLQQEQLAYNGRGSR